MSRQGSTLTYDQQCLMAVARALPEDDEYRIEILDGLKNDRENQSLKMLTLMDHLIPFFCGTGEFDNMDFMFSLEQASKLGEDSGLAKAYQRFSDIYATDKAKVMFVRLHDPKRLNVVLHTLTNFRPSWDPAVMLYIPRYRQPPLFVEKRTTFCRLFAGIGFWALGRPGRVVLIDNGPTTDDLRIIYDKDARYRAAVRVAGKWGYRRTRSLMFRDLDDEAFTKKVIEMQMEKRVETGSW